MTCIQVQSVINPR